MPINASIPLGVQPVQLPDFASLAVKRASVMNAMSEMATRQRALNEQNALAGIVQSEGYDPNDAEWRKKTAFYAPNLGPDFLKANDDAAATASAREKALREETSAKQMTAFQRLLSFKSGEEARADAQSHFKDYEPGVGKSIIEGIPTDPAEFDKWRVSHMQRILQMASPDKALETENQNVDLGNRVVQQSWQKYGGQPPTGTMVKGMSPDQAADNARQAAADRTAGSRALVATDNEGNITTISPDGKSIVGQFAGIGKPSAGMEKARAEGNKKTKDIQAAEGVIDQLLVDGGLIDIAGGGGVTTGVNVAARLAGKNTKEMDALAEIQPLQYTLLQQVERFEGPQSDGDRAEYKSAAGKLADPMALPSEKKAALRSMKTVLARQKTYQEAHPYAGAVANKQGGGVEDGGEYELVNGKLVLKK